MALPSGKAIDSKGKSAAAQLFGTSSLQGGFPPFSVLKCKFLRLFSWNEEFSSFCTTNVDKTVSKASDTGEVP